MLPVVHQGNGDYMSESASHHASATSGIPQPHGGLGIFRLVTTVITLIVGGGVFTLAGRPGCRRRQRRGYPHCMEHLGNRGAVPRHDVLRALAHQAAVEGRHLQLCECGVRRLFGLQQRLGLLDQRASVHGPASRRFCSARFRTSSPSSAAARTCRRSSAPACSSGSTCSSYRAASKRLPA